MNEKLKRDLAERRARIEVLENELAKARALTENLYTELLESNRGMTALALELEDKRSELERSNARLRREIAERVRAEEALQESEEMYRTIFQATGTAAMMIKADTTISLANAEFENLSGYSKEEIEGKKSWTEFAAEDHLERMKEYHRLRRVDPNAAPRDYEFQFVNRVGNIRDCLITVTMIPATEKSVAFIVDITQRKEEAERIQAAKMESLRQLVAGVAHEMNNPIGAISSSSNVSGRAIGKIKEIITEEYSQEIKEHTQLAGALDALEKMDQVHQIASAGITKIVANLQRFVRLDEAEWQYGDIHEGMDSVIALMGPEFLGRIRVTRDYSDIPRVYCSPGSLNQVFMNLFRNASEAIEGKGEMRLRTFAQGDHVKIEISDTGRGIPAEDMDRIFDPGFTTKGMRVGVGLGLPICYKIVVDEHRGRIYVSSEIGKGTTFTITLPI
jgi:PAS domain S-box-containing protein